jgi:two-component system, OmpR family, response regulator
MIPLTDGGPPLSVLIADGHEDGAESLACLLRMYGHNVTVARTGTAALAAAARFPPDVFIVEPRLAGVDGWEVARQLRSAAPSPVCIAVTGGTRPDDRQRSFAAGIEVHLLKPAEPDTLVAILAGVSRDRAPVAPTVCLRPSRAADQWADSRTDEKPQTRRSGDVGLVA